MTTQPSAAQPAFCTIAAYRFTPLEDLSRRRADLLSRCRAWQLRGTILLAAEGINLFVSGSVQAIDEFVAYLESQPEFAGIPVKYNRLGYQPFNRLLVRLKKEIIALGDPSIRPHQYTSARIAPRDLKALLDSGGDVQLIDVRNDYEIEVGTFDKAEPVGVRHFRELHRAIENLPEEWKHRPIVMFCTGGIRCEKAGPLFEQHGFANVRQLDGGILKYFEECGQAHYRGDCFVFDQRVAVTSQLEESNAAVCFNCQAVLTAADQQRPEYEPPSNCHHCFRKPSENLADVIESRRKAIRRFTDPLPGSAPYDNVRPIHVPRRLHGATVRMVLATLLGHLGNDYWQRELNLGHLSAGGQILRGDEPLGEGTRLEHRCPQTIEPDVASDIDVLYEDSWLVAVNKPSPLPVHPCGRFHRNTLTHILNEVYRPQVLRPAHRLDADTSGVMVLAKTRRFARMLQPLFEELQVEKTYLAKVGASPDADRFRCQIPISDGPESRGKRRPSEIGLTAVTEFTVLERFDDGTTTLLCRPLHGRTNQIRIHLAAMGLPIVGDRLYGPAPECSSLTADVADAFGTVTESKEDSAPPAATRDLGDPPFYLHAYQISFLHPMLHQRMTFTAPSTLFTLPADAVESLR